MSDDDRERAVCVCFAHCRVLRDPVTVSQLATTPLNINKPWFVYFVHWKGENIFASFFPFHFLWIVATWYPLINNRVVVAAAMETGQQRERELQPTHTKFNALFVCINCTGANQTGDSSDFIFPSPALVQLFRLIAFFSRVFFFFLVWFSFTTNVFRRESAEKRKQKKNLTNSVATRFVASFDTMWRDWRLLLMRAWPRAPTGCWPSFRLPSLSLSIRFVLWFAIFSLLLLSFCIYLCALHRLFYFLLENVHILSQVPESLILL